MIHKPSVIERDIPEPCKPTQSNSGHSEKNLFQLAFSWVKNTNDSSLACHYWEMVERSESARSACRRLFVEVVRVEHLLSMITSAALTKPYEAPRSLTKPSWYPPVKIHHTSRSRRCLIPLISILLCRVDSPNCVDVPASSMSNPIAVTSSLWSQDPLILD